MLLLLIFIVICICDYLAIIKLRLIDV